MPRMICPFRCATLAMGLALAALSGCAGTTTVVRAQPEETEPTEPAPVVREAPVATANTTRVTFAEDGADFDPSISRDGQWMVFASTQHRTGSDIYIKRINARVMTQLTNDVADDAMPTFSPDGSKIAFASNRAGNWDIYVMPVGGGKAVQLTQDGADELHPSWSPTGSELVYSRRNAGNGRWEMWTIDASNPQTTSFIGYGLFPQWCPTAATGESGSDRIVYQLARERGSRSYGIWTLDYRDGVAGNPTEIASDPQAAFINPTWSEDGQWIVFAQADVHAGTERPSMSDLWMVSAEGTGLVRLTTDEAVACQPTFGGGRLYYVSNRTGADNVWSLDVSSAIASADSAPAAVTNAAEDAESLTDQ